MAFSSLHSIGCPIMPFYTSEKRAGMRIPRRLNFSPVAQIERSSAGRRIWRRRRLTKKDETLEHRIARVPFLEEQVRKIREEGEIIGLDIERLMLSEDNRFAFVNDVAAEAKAYVESNRDEYGLSKKAIYHVLTNRLNDSGIYRPEAYVEPDPSKSGQSKIRREL